MEIILGIVVFYFVYLFFYKRKKNKKTEEVVVEKKQYKLPNRSLNYDFSINNIEINNGTLNISILLHNFTDKPVTAELKNAYYISAKTRTQYKGSCVRIVNGALGVREVDPDNMILPGLNIKRDIGIFRFDQEVVNEKDILLTECLFNGSNIVLKNGIYS